MSGLFVLPPMLASEGGRRRKSKGATMENARTAPEDQFCLQPPPPGEIEEEMMLAILSGIGVKLMGYESSPGRSHQPAGAFFYLFGWDDTGRRTRRSHCSDAELCQGPAVAPRTQECRADGGTAGSGKRGAAASHCGGGGLERCGSAGRGSPSGAAFHDTSTSARRLDGR